MDVYNGQIYPQDYFARGKYEVFWYNLIVFIAGYESNLEDLGIFLSIDYWFIF